MDIKRRRHCFGDMLTEDQLTRTELQEIEDGIIKELALPVVSCKESATQDDDTWVRVKFD
ncbi:hypothetical protein [Mogibacterium sp. CM50]|jgi:hypothetical protein|uniref:hypothetical protein n=1 Tax=Mogibacterium sp. CM50 TaxID=936375 RepID=UPI00027C35D2|nr:hypothetical protein [Mogibacterium sp. CM50]EJU21603.1 hypothetical protein HMPREF1152_0663 [Mogibacterium sp. CM50]